MYSNVDNMKKRSNFHTIPPFVYSVLILLFQELFHSFEEEEIPILHMSTLTEEGVIELRNEVVNLVIHVTFQ